MRILLVDDHALVRSGVKRLLASVLDGEILEAATGREALNLLRGGFEDLVLLDLNLPGLGGLELLQRITQSGWGPVLVLSMHAELLYIRRALDAGAAGYATKNISPDELVLAVRKVLAGGRYVEAEIAQALAIQGGGARHRLRQSRSSSPSRSPGSTRSTGRTDDGETGSHARRVISIAR